MAVGGSREGEGGEAGIDRYGVDSSARDVQDATVAQTSGRSRSISLVFLCEGSGGSHVDDPPVDHPSKELFKRAESGPNVDLQRHFFAGRELGPLPAAVANGMLARATRLLPEPREIRRQAS
jgi:hypothetical protein